MDEEPKRRYSFKTKFPEINPEFKDEIPPIPYGIFDVLIFLQTLSTIPFDKS